MQLWRWVSAKIKFFHLDFLRCVNVQFPNVFFAKHILGPNSPQFFTTWYVCLLVGSCEYGNSIDVLLAISYFYKSLFCEIHEHYLVLT